MPGKTQDPHPMHQLPALLLPAAQIEVGSASRGGFPDVLVYVGTWQVAIPNTTQNCAARPALNTFCPGSQGTPAWQAVHAAFMSSTLAVHRL